MLANKAPAHGSKGKGMTLQHSASGVHNMQRDAIPHTLEAKYPQTTNNRNNTNAPLAQSQLYPTTNKRTSGGFSQT